MRNPNLDLSDDPIFPPERMAIHPHRVQGLFLFPVAVIFVLLSLRVGGWHFALRSASLLLVSLSLSVSGVIVDRRRDRVTVIPRFRLPRRRRLSEFSRLLLLCNSGRRITYSVSLSGPNGAALPHLGLLDFGRYSDARRPAEQIAAYAGLDIHDLVFNPPITRPRAAAWLAPDRSRAAGGAAEHARERTNGAGRATTHVFDEPFESLDVLRVDHRGSPTAAVLAVLLYVLAAALAVVACFSWLLMPAFSALALLLAAAGTTTVLSQRRGVVFVRGRGDYFAWRWFRHSRFGKWLPLDPTAEVTVTHEKRSIGSDQTQRCYCVRLDGPQALVDLQETEAVPGARELAGRVAAFVGLGLRDFTRSPETKESLRLKLFQSTRRWSLSFPPEGTKIRLDRSGTECVFHLPARGLGWWKAPLALWLITGLCLVALLGVIFLGVNGWAFGNLPPALRGLAAGAAVLGVILYPLISIALVAPLWCARRRRERIHVSPQSVRVVAKAMGMTWRSEVSADAIHEIKIGRPTSDEFVKGLGHLYAPKEVIRVAEMTRAVEFGGGLTHSERVWLRSAVAVILLAPSTDAPEDSWTAAASA